MTSGTPSHRSRWTRYGKYGPRSGYGFLRTACQPIRIENFGKPYNKKTYWALFKIKLDTVLYKTDSENNKVTR